MEDTSLEPANYAGCGFIDVICWRCGKRYGWYGHMGNDSGCPRCRTYCSKVATPTEERQSEARLQIVIILTLRRKLNPSELLFIKKAQQQKTPFTITQIESIQRIRRQLVQ